MKQKCRQSFGFTLIELLIVVAIIGILAAIAVPNFLNAQTRAKLARCKADLKAISMAEEMYFLDNNVYTYPFVLHSLTTPVSYISSIPPDVFAPKHTAVNANSGTPTAFTWYRYVYGTTLPDWGQSQYPGLRNAHCADYWAYFAPFLLRSAASSKASSDGCPTQWLLKSFGPNVGQNALCGSNGDDCTFRYDPSNGLVSIGDIAVFGPGGMVE